MFSQSQRLTHLGSRYKLLSKPQQKNYYSFVLLILSVFPFDYLYTSRPLPLVSGFSLFHLLLLCMLSFHPFPHAGNSLLHLLCCPISYLRLPPLFQKSLLHVGYPLWAVKITGFVPLYCLYSFIVPCRPTSICFTASSFPLGNSRAHGEVYLLKI